MYSKSFPDFEESKDFLERKKINLQAMIEIFNFSPTVWFGLNTLLIEGFMLQEKKVDLILRLSPEDANACKQNWNLFSVRGSGLIH